MVSLERVSAVQVPTTASVYGAVSRMARDGHKGHLWSETVMPLYSEETGMSLSGS